MKEFRRPAFPKVTATAIGLDLDPRFVPRRLFPQRCFLFTVRAAPSCRYIADTWARQAGGRRVTWRMYDVWYVRMVS